MRRQHHTARDGARNLGPERRIAQHIVDDRHRQAGLGVGGAAGIDVGRREQILDRWGTNIHRPDGAQLDVLVQLAGETQLPGLDSPGSGIIGGAPGGIEVQRVHEGVLQDRDIDLKEPLSDIDVRRREVGVVAHRIAALIPDCGGDVFAGFLAVVKSECHRDVAGAQRPGQFALHGRFEHVHVHCHILEVLIVVGHIGDAGRAGDTLANGIDGNASRHRRHFADGDGGLARQRGTADDAAQSQARIAAIGIGDNDGVLGGDQIGENVRAVGADRKAGLGMGEIGVPKPVGTQRAIQREDATDQLAAVVGCGRRQRACGLLGIVLAGDGIVVEIVGIQRAHGEGRNAGGNHGLRHRSRQEGIVRLDHQAVVHVGLGVALAGEIAVIHLQRGFYRIGQLVGAVHEQAVGLVGVAQRLPGRFAVPIGQRTAIGKRSGGDIAEIHLLYLAALDKADAAKGIGWGQSGDAIDADSPGAGGARRDQAADGANRQTDVIGNDKLGIGVARGGGGEVRVRDQIGAAIPFLLDQQRSVGTIVVFGCQLDMAFIAREILAPHCLGGNRAHHGICGRAALNLALEAYEILVDDEINHTCHSVGAPGRRSAAGHDIHALDDGAGQGGDVHAARQVGVHDALAVEQNQGAVDAEIAQIEQVCARRAGRGRTLRDAEGGWRGIDLGQLPHIIGDVGVGVALDFLGIHDRNRGRRRETADRNARTADDDRFHIFGRLLRLRARD